jgi:hypothetical protein
MLFFSSPCVLSKVCDHQTISLKIKHKAESRGREYFKLNSKILENEEYKEIIKQLISKYQKKLVIQKTDTRTLWDVFKAEVRVFSNLFSS